LGSMHQKGSLKTWRDSKPPILFALCKETSPSSHQWQWRYTRMTGNRVYKSCVAWELGVIYQPRASFLWIFLVAFSVAKFCVLLSSSQSIIISSSLQPFQGTHLPPINNPGPEAGPVGGGGVATVPWMSQHLHLYHDKNPKIFLG
jgi:hypothetical protein